ncbi:hypothetical protein C3L33_02536, partial [Rhododendron williamsianum]
MLADSAVVAEELWWQAIDYARLNHSTISYFYKSETAASRWNRISLNASKVGKGLSKDAKAQKLAFQHWIEAIDPRHRYGHYLHLYYEEWCKTDAGQPFFYWLDLGDGMDVELIECPRSKLRQQCIIYLGPQERENYQYIVVGGKIVHKQSGNFLDTTKGKPGEKWIFVMSTSKKLYAGQKKKGIFHHSSFLAGGATLAAGRLAAEDGTLKSISPYSGHYRPTDDSLDSFLSFLKQNGVDLDRVAVCDVIFSYIAVKKSGLPLNPQKESWLKYQFPCSFLNLLQYVELLDIVTRRRFFYQILKANDDYEKYEESKPKKEEITSEFSTYSESPQPVHSIEEESLESPVASQTETKNNYKRTLSGGLQSARAEVPEKAILQRINSKKAASSYQLGHQLSRTWSTGAGPRIGCVADYPVELRLQALELVNLSPRTPPTHRWMAGLASPTTIPESISAV